MEEAADRIAPAQELVNAFEMEAMAKRKLDSAAFRAIAGSDRKAFDRITLRPRMMVNTTDLNLTAELFGQSMFTPLLVGPSSQQKRFHPEGELAMVRGASAAKTTVVIADRSSVPIEEIAAAASTTLWYQVRPEPDMEAVRKRVQAAVKCGCKAVCLTLGISEQPLEIAKTRVDWEAIGRLREGLTVPLLLKGIMSPEEAAIAVKRGVQGIIVSNYRGPSESELAASIEVLPAVADAVSGKVPILVDGSFRLGSDVLKALALGATAVLLGRPPLWGLAAYGADGVQRVLEFIQAELARSMAMCGRPNVKSIQRSDVRVHRW
jgi:isopentenyl diphosphate isomerase/L-lactate dehydrogenase-like FMN-dependent dehydrogenase